MSVGHISHGDGTMLQMKKRNVSWRSAKDKRPSDF
jgi:hypothetical protein